MSIEIKEYFGANINIKSNDNKSKGQLNLTEGLTDNAPKISKDSIMQDIEGIHVGPTRNYTWYMECALKSSINSWTKPYFRPLIMHHNEQDGKIIGRVVGAEMKYVNTRSGTPAIEFTCNVPDTEGKEQILDGRLSTVSIGVIAHDVRCSICNEQVELDENGYPECGHMKGCSYDEEMCYWKIYSMEAKELSYVIVPSDIYAHNTRTYKPSENPKSFTEKMNTKNMEGISMTENKESNIISEEVKAEATIVKKVEEVVEEIKEVIEEVVEEVKETEIAEEVKEEKTEEVKEVEEKIKEEVIEEIKEDTTVADLEALQVQIAELQGTIEKLTANLREQESLVKAAEDKIVEQEVELRESMEMVFNTYREKAGKSQIVNLSERSIESLRHSICDLKEEIQEVKSVSAITEAVNPTLAKDTEEKNNKASVNKIKNKSNVQLGERAIKDIFSSFLN